MIHKVNVAEKLSLFTEHYRPRVIGELNDSHVKVVKLQGEFLWHHHDNEDELFYVVKGELGMRVREDGAETEFTILPGEFIIIPRGVEHLPSAEQETHVLLLEPRTTLNTGNLVNQRTVAQLEKI
jgi:mannose-6-phosphate isomerase-like protein (cupin superfamily)